MIIRLRKVKALMRKWDEFLNFEPIGWPFLHRKFLKCEVGADSGFASRSICRDSITSISYSVGCFLTVVNLMIKGEKTKPRAIPDSAPKTFATISAASKLRETLLITNCSISMSKP